MKVQVWLSIALLPYFLSKFCILSTGIPFSLFLSSIEFHCLSLPEKGNFEGDAKRTMNKRKRFKRSLQETCTATNLYIPNARKNIFWRKGIKDTLKRDKKRWTFTSFFFGTPDSDARDRRANSSKNHCPKQSCVSWSILVLYSWGLYPQVSGFTGRMLPSFLESWGQRTCKSDTKRRLFFMSCETWRSDSLGKLAKNVSKEHVTD